MKATLQPENVKALPAVAQWLEVTDPTHRILRDNFPDLKGQELLDKAVENNVLMQIQNLQTHPSVASALIAGTVQLHAWNYRVESGRVLAFDSKSRKFIPLEELWAETAGAASEVGRSGVFKRPS